MWDGALHHPKYLVKSATYDRNWRATPDEDGHYTYAIAL